MAMRFTPTKIWCVKSCKSAGAKSSSNSRPIRKQPLKKQRIDSATVLPFFAHSPRIKPRTHCVRSVRYLTVTPMQVNFPCIHSVAEIHRDSTVKKTLARSFGQRIYLSSRQTEPPAHILSKVRLRWNVENKNHHPRDATFLEDKCRCTTKNTAANLALLRGAVLMLWKKTTPDRPAPSFIRRNQRKIDAMIGIISKNQRLTKIQ